MATEAQINANRRNAQSSTGPRTPEGKARCGGNNATFGLFATRDSVHPDEAAEYRELSDALLENIRPVTAIEKMHANQIVRASWRLLRCDKVEDALHGAPASSSLNPDAMRHADIKDTQLAVDRARLQCHNIVRRATAELRALQTERHAREMVMTDHADHDSFGLFSTKEAISVITADWRRQLVGAEAKAQGTWGKAISNLSQRNAERTRQRIAETEAAKITTETQFPSPAPERESESTKFTTETQFQTPRNTEWTTESPSQPAPATEPALKRMSAGASGYAPDIHQSEAGHPL